MIMPLRERVALKMRAMNCTDWPELADLAISEVLRALEEPSMKALEAAEESTWDPSSDRPYIDVYTLKYAFAALLAQFARELSPSPPSTAPKE